MGGGIISTLGGVIGIAGSLVSVLTLGYVLTNAVNAFAFGAYLSLVPPPRAPQVPASPVFATLSGLLESASLAFLFTFTVVLGLAFLQGAGSRILTAVGALRGAAAPLASIVRPARTEPMALAGFGAMALLVVLGRPLLLRSVEEE